MHVATGGGAVGRLGDDGGEFRGTDTRRDLDVGSCRDRHFGFAEMIQSPPDVDAGSPRVKSLTQADPANRLCQRRCAEVDVGGQLRPRRQGPVDLYQRRGGPWREPLGVEMPQDVWDLLAAAHPGKQPRVDFAEQSVEDGALRLKVEAFDVDQAAIAGGHQHGDAAAARGLAHDCLHVQRVAFLHHDVDTVHEIVDGVEVESVLEHVDR